MKTEADLSEETVCSHEARTGARLTVAQIVLSLEVGGLEQVVVNLVKGLNRARFRNVVCALSVRGRLADELAGSCDRILVLNKGDGLSWKASLQIMKFLREEGASIVHCHNFGPLVYGSVAARLTGAKVVYTAHGPDAAAREKLSLLRKFGLIDRVVAVSDDSRELAARFGGFEDHWVRTIANGVDTNRFHPRPGVEEKRRKLGIVAGQRVLGCIGRLSRDKDHDTLLAALSPIIASGENVHLLIVGDGPRRVELEARAKLLGHASRVTFLGDRSDIPELLSLFDVFVLATNREGMSMTILEAMASGLPVITTDVGGSSQIITHARTGWLVPRGDARSLADAVIWTLGHDAESLAVATAARESVEARFSVEQMVRQYENLYSDIAA